MLTLQTSQLTICKRKIQQIKSPVTGLQAYTFQQWMMNKLQSVSGKEGKHAHQPTACTTVVIHRDVLRRIDIFIMQTKSNVAHNSNKSPGCPVLTNLATVL